MRRAFLLAPVAAGVVAAAAWAQSAGQSTPVSPQPSPVVVQPQNPTQTTSSANSMPGSGTTQGATANSNTTAGTQFGQPGAALNNGATANGTTAALNNGAGAGLDGGTGAGTALNNGAGPADSGVESTAARNSPQSATAPGGGANSGVTMENGVPVARGSEAAHGQVLTAPATSEATTTTPGGYQIGGAPAPAAGPALGSMPQDGGTP